MRALAFAWRSLLRRRGRSALGILGIAAAGALMFDMLLLSRGLLVSVRELLDRSGSTSASWRRGDTAVAHPDRSRVRHGKGPGRAAGSGLGGAVPDRRGRGRRGARPIR